MSSTSKTTIRRQHDATIRQHDHVNKNRRRRPSSERTPRRKAPPSESKQKAAMQQRSMGVEEQGGGNAEEQRSTGATEQEGAPKRDLKHLLRGFILRSGINTKQKATHKHKHNKQHMRALIASSNCASTTTLLRSMRVVLMFVQI